MLINFSLTRPCIQKMQILAHSRVSNKLKAAMLSPFAGIALPFGDACMHTALALIKTPFLVAPLSIGRLAGKGFVSSLNRRSPRHALLAQMAFHVVRGLASLTLLAVSTLAIPTIPFLVVMPRIVSKTHDRLGLNRLFKMQIALKPAVKPIAIVKAAAPLVIKATPPSIQTTPVAKIATYAAPQQQVIAAVQRAKPELPQAPAPILPLPLPTSQPILTPIAALPSVPTNPTAAPLPVVGPSQDQQSKAKVKWQVGLPSETQQRPPKAVAHQEAERIKLQLKRTFGKTTKPVDPLPLAPLAPAPLALAPLALYPLAMPAPVPPSATVSQPQPSAAVTAQASAPVAIEAEASAIASLHEIDRLADELQQMAAEAHGDATAASSALAQQQASRLSSHFKNIRSRRQASASLPQTTGSTEATPHTSPRGSSSTTPQGQSVEQDQGKAQIDGPKLKNVFRALKPRAPAVANGQNPTISSILAAPQATSQLSASIPVEVVDAKADGSKLKNVIKSKIRKRPADENQGPSNIPHVN